MVTKVLTNMGAVVQAQAMMNKVVVHMVILYRIESWEVTEAMMKVLEGFHHQLGRRIVGMSTW